MAFGYVLDPIFADHRAPGAHPECPERIASVQAAFTKAGFQERCTELPVRAALEDELAQAHTAEYLRTLESQVAGKSGWMDPDTFFSEGTWAAVLSAAGAAIDLSTAVLDGRFRRGAALVRPPGHHAEADRAMGFCMVNNVAVAAAMARAGGARVSIVDWDVHHGNGTQHIFEADSEVQYLSIHQYPFYPGSGAPTEVGIDAGVGTTVNLALPAGCDDADYVAGFDRVLAPELRRFKPDLVLLSAGFDALEVDPLAQMSLSIAGMRALARRLVALCEHLCGGKLVAVLEGGYDLAGLGQGVVCLLDEMMDFETTPRGDEGGTNEPSRAALDAIVETQDALSSIRGGRSERC